MHQFASRSPFVFFFIALLAAGVNAAALAAPKLQQFAVVGEGGDHAALIEDTHSLFITYVVAFASSPWPH